MSLENLSNINLDSYKMLWKYAEEGLDQDIIEPVKKYPNLEIDKRKGHSEWGKTVLS